MTAKPNPQIVLCIPGNWADREELAQKIAAHSGGYLLDGAMLTKAQADASFVLQIEPSDPRMLPAFSAVGSHWADTDDMRKIGRHTLVAYLVGSGGSHSRAVALMLAAAGLVKAGGLGVKLESSGIAHSPEAWLTMTDERHLFSAHAAFVVYVTDAEVYSCGMHSFGLRDVVVAEDQADDPVDLLRVFTWYLFTETPTICSGQTFSLDKAGPSYRVTTEDCTQYEEGELFKNPYGMWRLSKIA